MYLNVILRSLEVDMSEWISVGKLKPNDGQRVIAFVDSCFVVLAQFKKGSFYDVVKDGDGVFFETVSRDVTHWMPLPKPPVE